MKKILLLTLLFLTGCATMEAPTSGAIGCPTSEIKIENYDFGAGQPTTTWQATCRGKRFFCSLSKSLYSSAITSCKEELAPSAAK